MIQNVKAAAAANVPAKVATDAAPAPGAAVKTDVAPAKAVPTLKDLDARAFMQRQQIGAGLYDRSLTFRESTRALQRQDAIAAYAASIQAKEGGPTASDLKRLERKLDRAAAQLERLSTNGKGADLDSLEAIDGRDLDIVQENLANRIKAGLRDGSLTEDEGKTLVAQQEKLNEVEIAFRESGGKLTAGEQKQLLDELRKSADLINKLRHNNVGTNASTFTYGDAIDKRQAALEKELARGIERGSLTADEADAVRAEFEKVNALEVELRGTDGKVNGREWLQASTAMNTADALMYDLQRNKQGVQLAEVYVDVKHADLRQAQQLESLARGITNGNLTNGEAEELLGDQESIQRLENRYVASGEGLDRGEYLRLQNAMNDFALRNGELQSNRDRYTGLVTRDVSGIGASVKPAAPAPTPAPVAPAPVADVAPVAPNPAQVSPAAVAEVAVRAETPAEQAEAEVKAARDSKPAPEAAPAPRKPEVVENRFGQMVTDMLKSLEAQARDQHDTMVARLREKLDAAKDKPAAFAPRDVDAERKVAAYAKTGAPGLEQALSKKVA